MNHRNAALMGIMAAAALGADMPHLTEGKEKPWWEHGRAGKGYLRKGTKPKKKTWFLNGHQIGKE